MVVLEGKESSALSVALDDDDGRGGYEKFACSLYCDYELVINDSDVIIFVKDSTGFHEGNYWKLACWLGKQSNVG